MRQDPEQSMQQSKTDAEKPAETIQRLKREGRMQRTSRQVICFVLMCSLVACKSSMKYTADTYFDLSSSGEEVVVTIPGTGESDLAILDLSLSGHRRTISTEYREQYPTFLSDDRVLCSSYVNGKEKLIVVDFSSHKDEVFLDSERSLAYPVSVRSQSIVIYAAYARKRNYGMGEFIWDDADLWICDSSGKKPKQLSSGRYRRIFLTNGCCSGDDIYAAVETSDGKQDVYAFSISRPLSAPRKITDNGYAIAASVSEDGSKLLTVELTGKTWGWDVFERDLKTKKRRQLTHLSKRIMQAQYEPDGSILYMIDEGSGGGGGLWRLSAAGADPVLVLPTQSQW